MQQFITRKIEKIHHINDKLVADSLTHQEAEDNFVKSEGPQGSIDIRALLTDVPTAL